MSQIPIISLKKYRQDDEGVFKLAEAVDNALTTFGVFFIVDHGIDASFCEKSLADLKEFFDQPIEKKRLYQMSNRYLYRGYEPLGAVNINAYMNRPGQPYDLLERFIFGSPDPVFSAYYSSDPTGDQLNTWAPNLYAECFRESMQKYYKEVEQVAHFVMRAMSIAMGQPEQFLPDMCSRASHSLNASHYPVVSSTSGQQTRMAEHVDIAPLVLLLQDGTKDALKVRSIDGEWVSADAPRPDAILALVGECGARLTNDHWPAALHYVSLPDRSKMKSRISLQLFVQLNKETFIKSVPKFLDENGGRSVFEPKFYKDIKQRIKKLMSENTDYA